jgi:hypothetical protein
MQRIAIELVLNSLILLEKESAEPLLIAINGYLNS